MGLCVMLGGSIRLALSGGGTGGHIFPALAIAQAVEDLVGRGGAGVEGVRGVDVRFYGARDRMEMDLVPRYGYEVVGLPSVGMPRGGDVLGKARFAWRMARSVVAAWRSLRSWRPDVVVGVGGYVSVPAVWVAQRMGIPTILQEQNSFAGRANRFLSGRARAVCVAYEGMEKDFACERVILTGNPIRGEFVTGRLDRGAARARLGLAVGGRVVLVLGGSLGAGSLNEAIVGSLDRLSGLEDVTVVLQCGANYYAAVQARVAGAGVTNVIVRPFLDDMSLYYAASDVVVARCGASTLSELCLVGRPCVLVPSPNVVEDHQRRNAQALVSAGAARMVEDDRVGVELLDTVLELLGDGVEQSRIVEALGRLARPDAARTIAFLALELAKEKA